MDYYNYQNLNCGTSNEVSQVPACTANNGNNSYYYGNYVSNQHVTPSYHHSDPRLNYACYNPIPQNTQLSHDFPSQVYDLSLPKDPTVLETKTDDELWLETWLSKIGKIQINLNSTVEIKPVDTVQKSKSAKNVITLHAAKSSLRNSLGVIDTLQKLQEFLKENAATMSSEEWKKKTTEIGLIKDQFSKLVLPFENPEIVTNLRKAVEKRRKKRENQKRQRKYRSQYLKEIYLNRHKMHKDADQWLENKKEDVERVKMEEKMKKDADCVLAEVTKKKGDARKSLTLITSLVKLRQVREHAALQRGEKVSLEDHTAFAEVAERLMKIWGDALQTYINEEQELKKTLEQTATEDSNAAREAKEKQIMQEWETAFFGFNHNPHPISWGLTAAERDLETFIAIRKSWDTFLTNSDDQNGTTIPIGWVTPNSYPPQSWTKYRV